MPRRVRDSQRSRLYRAEVVLANTFDAPRFPGLASVNLYYSKLLCSAWFQWRYRLGKVEIRDGRGRNSACADVQWRGHETIPTGVIWLPRWARNEPTMLHELAHCCCDATPDGRREAAHGWRFAQVYLELVRRQMGQDAERALRESFRKHRVRYKAPRCLSPEQRVQINARSARAADVLPAQTELGNSN